MKKIKLLSLLGIGTVLMLTSCSIEKRLYSPGYHVEWGHEKNGLNTKTEQSAIDPKPVSDNNSEISVNTSSSEQNLSINKSAQQEKIETKETVSGSASLTSVNKVSVKTATPIANNSIKQVIANSKAGRYMRSLEQLNPHDTFWDKVKEHPGRYILIGLFAVLVIVIFIVTGGQGFNSRQ